MASIGHALLTIRHRTAFAAGLLVAFVATATTPPDRSLLAGEVVIKDTAPAQSPQTRPVDEQAPQRSEHPEQRKRTRDGPPQDELQPSGRRLPA